MTFKMHADFESRKPHKIRQQDRRGDFTWADSWKRYTALEVTGQVDCRGTAGESAAISHAVVTPRPEAMPDTIQAISDWHTCLCFMCEGLPKPLRPHYSSIGASHNLDSDRLVRCDASAAPHLTASSTAHFVTKDNVLVVDYPAVLFLICQSEWTQHL